MNLDIIGDVHGHAIVMESLLKKLGYRHTTGAWRHPSRTAIFVGDLIDRGPDQLRTLKIVRDMTEAGTARVVMGNHEFNALGWATPDGRGDYMRTRHGTKGDKNRKQHTRFLEEVGEDSAEHKEWVEWFMDLPLWLDLPSLRIIHACWDPLHIDALRPMLRDGSRLTYEALAEASTKGTIAYQTIETLLKGPEAPLPKGHSFIDKDGTEREDIRLAWWKPNAQTYPEAYVGPPGVVIPDVPLPAAAYRLPEPEKPTFIGHYWFGPDARLEPAARRVACVDYSAGRGGPLVAYRFDGEDELVAQSFAAAREPE